MLIANVLSVPLRELAPPIIVLPVAGGHLGLAGVLATQAQSVADAYKDKFELDAVAEKEEWCRITGVKKA